MSKRKKVVTTEEKTAPLERNQRNLAMFKDYVTGMTQADIAVKYSITEDNVNRISRESKWKSLRAEALEKAYASTVALEIKSMTRLMTGALKRDMEMIVADMVKNTRELTHDERAHFRATLDRFLKETRLEDGKPTEINDGTHRIEIALPPGVKRFGIIPPDPRVTIIEHEAAKASETINLDELDLDPEKIK